MTGFWDRLRGKGTGGQGADDPLRRLFGGYPVNLQPHQGPPESLRAAQQEENLAAFLRRREHRLAVLLEFLDGHGISAAPLLDAAGDGAAAAGAIDFWLNAALPRRASSMVSGDPQPNPDLRAFIAGDRAADGGYYSFLDDLGLLEGEAIRRRDRRFDWAINQLPEQAELDSYGRICLIKPGTLDWPPLALDVPVHLLSVCHAKMAPNGDSTGHRFGELLAGALAGAFDPGGTAR